MTSASLGALLGATRAAHGLSLSEVAGRAGCSPAYVHKLESDRVRTPSPRVLARLAEALGLSYDELMAAAGYEAVQPASAARELPGAVQRYSNAHIVLLLEELLAEVRELRSRLPGATEQAVEQAVR